MSTAHQTSHSAEINRAQINQANAQHSTGPKSAEGKRRSSLNALRHGLTSQLVVMPAENLQAYQRHVASFADEYHPQGATEAHLVRSLADLSWRLNRVAALETNLIDEAESAESLSKALANLSMHSQRLSRQFERTAAQLRDLQTTRRAQEQAELDKLLDILEMHEYSGKPFDPTPHGFVFSDPEIQAGFQARTLYKLAHQAHPYRYSSAR
jgi:ABC-type transporter Mla subunit MlaD